MNGELLEAVYVAGEGELPDCLRVDIGVAAQHEGNGRDPLKSEFGRSTPRLSLRSPKEKEIAVWRRHELNEQLRKGFGLATVVVPGKCRKSMPPSRQTVAGISLVDYISMQ